MTLPKWRMLYVIFACDKVGESMSGRNIKLSCRYLSLAEIIEVDQVVQEMFQGRSIVE